MAYTLNMVGDNADAVLYGQTPEREQARVRREPEQGVTLFYTEDWKLYKFIVAADADWEGSDETANVPLDVYLPGEKEYTFYVDEEGRLHRSDGPAVISTDGDCLEWWKHGLLHRQDGPAVSSPNGWEEWYFEGEYHRDPDSDGKTGPAFIWPANNEKRWYSHGKLHRDADATGDVGPAWIRSDGTEEWYQHGEQHRDPDPDGKELPAAVRPNGGREYYRHGLRHREDGPAVITDSGGEQYWLDDEPCSEEQWKQILAERKTEEGDGDATA